MRDRQRQKQRHRGTEIQRHKKTEIPRDTLRETETKRDKGNTD